jgi:uncharacterized membrane protein YhhN
MSLDVALSGVSAAAGMVFAVWFAPQPASLVRGLVKTAAVGALAVLAYVEGAPLPLIGALVLSAIGDALLAGETARWRAAGLAALLLACLSYLGLFIVDGGGRAALIAEPSRTLGVAAAFAAGVTLVAWLWRTDAARRSAAGLYPAVACLAAAASFTLPYRLWPAMAGASGLVIAAGLTVVGMTKDVRAGGLAWAIYYLAQALILWAYLR